MAVSSLPGGDTVRSACTGDAELADAINGLSDESSTATQGAERVTDDAEVPIRHCCVVRASRADLPDSRREPRSAIAVLRELGCPGAPTPGTSAYKATTRQIELRDRQFLQPASFSVNTTVPFSEWRVTQSQWRARKHLREADSRPSDVVST
jgi:hypothetical protein